MRYRNLTAIALLLIGPSIGGFALSLLWAVAYGLLGWDFDADKAWVASQYYVAGNIVGWWIFTTPSSTPQHNQ